MGPNVRHPRPPVTTSKSNAYRQFTLAQYNALARAFGSPPLDAAPARRGPFDPM